MDIKTLLDKLKIAHSGCESHEQIGLFKESIKEIIDTIESLKCCGNCGIMHNTLDGFECLRTCKLVIRSNKCEHWEPIR